MAETYHLSFSIGPVQSFVEQARRTRDLWAGSWLLSYLAECALAAAENTGGTAIIPARSDADRGQVTAKKTAVGGIPNRFELRFEAEDSQQQAIDAANAATKAFQEAWNRIAQAVFDKYITNDVCQKGRGTEQIWRRQVDNFWEITWVVGQPGDEEKTIGRLAAMRKNFRNVPASEESGVKCSLMPSLQELSGHLRRADQATFWRAVAENVGSLDIGDTERLSAIALIKRLFPKVIGIAIGRDISDELNQVSWPSTAFIAAVPWLKELQGESLELAKNYQQLALDTGYQRSEVQAARDAGVPWAVVDGPAWLASAVRHDQPGQCQFGPNTTETQPQQRRSEVATLLDILKQLYRHVGDSTADETRQPVPYYALLLMDGDSMGQLLARLGSPESLSTCLGRFASQVRAIVDRHTGRTVYAGGDDVLALLPAVSALQCAEELRAAYADAFKDEAVPSDVATISAAVVYAHWRYPLRQVLATAHHLLDDIAKERTGRDAIAIGIILGSGLNAVWSVPWDVYLGKAQTADNSPCAPLQQLLDRFDTSEIEETSDPPFNASFLYLLRERFGLLLGEGREQPGEFLRFAPTDSDAAASAAVLLRDLAHAEYRRRMKRTARAEKPETQTQPIVDQLMSLSRAWKRRPGTNGSSQNPELTCDCDTFGFDGWRVARFLRQIKDGKVADHD